MQVYTAYLTPCRPTRKAKNTHETAAGNFPEKVESKSTATGKAKPKRGQKPRPARLLKEQIRERNRTQMAKKCQDLKAAGLCIDCRGTNTTWKTRCEGCATGHGQAQTARHSA